jgi:hypothetical protein
MRSNENIGPCRTRIHISWVELPSKKVGLVAYDKENNQELVSPLIDYCLFLSNDEELDSKTVMNEMLYVRRFLEYLLEKNSMVVNVGDELIKSFRDAELKRVKLSPNRSPSENALKRTVNAKLRRIYNFLVWFQRSEDLVGLIGPINCKVRSSLAVPPDRGLGRGRAKAVSSGRNRFPGLYRGVGEGSKHRVKYVATVRDKDDLIDLFLEQESFIIANRNVLILELADQVGLRRGSINSLLAAQFRRDEIENSRSEHWVVVPSAQKFGYEKKYGIPFRLAYRVCDYIDQVRRKIMLEKGWSESRTGGRLFFSLRDGSPLSDQTISQIFGAALRKLGVEEHGSATHTLRRKFACESIVEETTRRQRLNLDTSVASVAAAVSIKMGHTNPESLTPYVSRVQAAGGNSEHETRERQLAELRDENQRLKIDLAKARNEENRVRTKSVRTPRR